MSATVTTLHQPWCTEHVDADPEVGSEGWCASKTETNGVEIELLNGLDEFLDGGVGVRVEIYSRPDNYLTPAQARDVAAALLAAVEKAERESA